jgi:hypothetical protein
MPKRNLSLLLPVLILSSCARSGTRTEPEPVPAEVPLPGSLPAPVSTTTSWTFVTSSQPHQYRSAITAIIEQGEAASSIRDSIRATTDFSLSLSKQPRSLAYEATINDLTIQGGPRTAFSSTPNQFPIPISGRLEGNRLSAESAPECSTQSSFALPIIQRLVVSLPSRLQKDQTWTDSTSATVCSGPIPVILTTIRSYRVLGEADIRGRPGIRLAREDRTTSQGEGSDGQHRVQLQSSSTGRGELLIDRTTGALLESSTISTVSLTITTSGRSQRFTQTSRELVTEHPH